MVTLRKEVSFVPLHPNRHIHFFLSCLYIALLAASGFFFFRYIFSWLLPLLLAYLISTLIAHPMRFLSQRHGLPRRVVAACFTLLALVLLGAALYWLLLWLLDEVSALSARLPDFLAQLPARLGGVEAFVNRLLVRLPEQWDIAPFSIETWVQNLQLPAVDLGTLLGSLGRVVGSLPGFFLSVVFVFLSSYFLSAERAAISAFCTRQLGRHADTLRRLRTFVHGTAWGWCKAQGVLVSITFLILWGGFLLSGRHHALLLALLLAFFDALPLFGAGVILVPWAALELLGGAVVEGGVLLALFVLTSVVRSCLEPRILGDRLGLHPFVTLLCLYFGFRLGGFGGMFLLPIAVLCAGKLRQWGVVRLWR